MCPRPVHPLRGCWEIYLVTAVFWGGLESHSIGHPPLTRKMPNLEKEKRGKNHNHITNIFVKRFLDILNETGYGKTAFWLTQAHLYINITQIRQLMLL